MQFLLYYLPGLNAYESFLMKFVTLTAIIIKGKPTNCTGNSNAPCSPEPSRTQCRTRKESTVQMQNTLDNSISGEMDDDGFFLFFKIKCNRATYDAIFTSPLSFFTFVTGETLRPQLIAQLKLTMFNNCNLVGGAFRNDCNIAIITIKLRASVNYYII